MANPWNWARDRASYLLYGPGGYTSSKRNTGPLTTPPALQPSRSSLVFDSHVVQEAASGKSKTPQTVSLAWDERGRYGLEDQRSSWTGMTSLERKQTLLNIYLANPWVSACVDVIAARICSGGFTVEKIDEGAEDNNDHHDQLMEFCLRVNDDWDLLQFARASITDFLIFGETYSEILWSKGLPYQLFSIDCLTMDYKIDQYGRVERFKQQLQSNARANWLDPANIIRWWRPHPRAKIDPFSPIEKAQDAIFLDKQMVNWQEKFFKKGARFPYYVKGIASADEAQRFQTYFEENVTGSKNAHKIPVLYGGAEFDSLGNTGAIQLDFDKGLDRMRTIIFASYQVPPAAVSIIESGNIGGGSGEDQDKSLQNNACDPVKGVFLEKLNDRIVKRGFGITDYRIGLRYAEYRSDKDIATVQELRLQRGLRTPNEIRQEDGKRPYEGYGDVPIIVTKDITPLPRIEAMQEEQAQSAGAALELAQANAEMAKVQVEKAKEPPEPVPAALQQANQQPEQLNKQQQSDASKETPEEPKIKEPEEEQESVQEAVSDLMVPDAQRSIWVGPDVQQQLQQLRDQGVTHIRWQVVGQTCDTCTLNDATTIPLGGHFPTGHQLPPVHPNCDCKVSYLHGEQEESEQIDPDDTQEMPAVKL